VAATEIVSLAHNTGAARHGDDATAGNDTGGADARARA
jgi:hypothetical protein